MLSSNYLPMVIPLTTQNTYYNNTLYKIKVLHAHRYKDHMLSQGAHSLLSC